MKKSINLILASAVFAFFVSCSKDDATTKPSNTQQAQENLEDKPVAVSVLETEIKIGNLIQKQGMPPVPVGNVDFKISTDQQEGYQKNGFNIKFSSTSAIEGAYILFQDVSGNKSKSYFNVPKASFGDENSTKRMMSKSNTKEVVAAATKEQVINVDFTDNFPPGEFCYEICLYDANNNVSAIEKICVKVEAWGGNSNLVGDWVFDRFIPKEDNTTKVYCASGDSITVAGSKTIKEDISFNVNANGSFEVINTSIEQDLDYESSRTKCEAVYKDKEEDKTKITGNWAYNDTKQTLTLVKFKEIDMLEPKNTKDYPEGDVMVDKGKVEFKNNELHITETDDDNQTIVFTKK